MILLDQPILESDFWRCLSYNCHAVGREQRKTVFPSRSDDPHIVHVDAKRNEMCVTRNARLRWWVLLPNSAHDLTVIRPCPISDRNRVWDDVNVQELVNLMSALRISGCHFVTRRRFPERYGGTEYQLFLGSEFTLARRAGCCASHATT
jgi:hypothetical protein